MGPNNIIPSLLFIAVKVSAFVKKVIICYDAVCYDAIICYNAVLFIDNQAA